VSLSDVKKQQEDVQKIVQSLQNSIKDCDASAANCSAPPLPSNDAYYKHLARLPLPVAWSSDYNELLAAAARVAPVVNKYNADHQVLMNFLEGSGMFALHWNPQTDPDCSKRNEASRRLMGENYRQNVKPVLDDLRRRDDDLPSQLRQLLQKTTLEATNRTRCGLSLSAFGCVTAPELDKLAQLAPTSGPHKVETESEDAVSAACPRQDLTVKYAP
jgi:hypothetical protein